MLTDEVRVTERWREYFNNLLNVENAREQLSEVPVVVRPVQEISREEVKKATESTKKGNAAGCSGLPIDLMNHLGESGMDIMQEIPKTV